MPDLARFQTAHGSDVPGAVGSTSVRAGESPRLPALTGYNYRDALGRRERLRRDVPFAPLRPIADLTPRALAFLERVTTWCDVTGALRPAIMDLRDWDPPYDGDAFIELVASGVLALADPYVAINPQVWHPMSDWRPVIPLELRLAVFARDGWSCVHCGAKKPLTLDHIHPYSLGGQDVEENLQTLCQSCNSRKGAKV